MTTMPQFVFARNRAIEIEAGLALAGMLIIDIPRWRKPSKKHLRFVAGLAQHLASEAMAGKLPDDATVYGWANGRRPADADDTIDNDELMGDWAKTRVTMSLRVDPRKDDGMLRLDSDILRQMGLAHDAPSGQQ